MPAATCRSDSILLSLHNAITTHPTRPPPYPGVNRQTLASLSFSATTASHLLACDFPPLTTSNNHRPRSPFYPGVNQKMHPLLIPQPALGTPPLPLPGSPCTLTLTSPSLPPSIPLSYPRVDCHTRTPARCHRPFLLHPEHRTPTARCSECNLLSQHSAIIPISSSSPRTHCTTARSPPGTTCRTCRHPFPQSPAFTHPPPPPSIPFSYPGVNRAPAHINTRGETLPRSSLWGIQATGGLVAGCLNGWGSRALLRGSCCRGSDGGQK